MITWNSEYSKETLLQEDFLTVPSLPHLAYFSRTDFEKTLIFLPQFYQGQLIKVDQVINLFLIFHV